MKKILFLLLSCLLSCYTSAGNRSETEMRQIAINQIYGNLAKGSIQISLKKVSTANAYSIYSGETKGYVIVSRYENCKPILGYSENTYDVNNLPDGFKWWLKEIERSLQYYEDYNITPPSMSKMVANYSAISSFITTMWGQSTPFNDKCPKINNAAAPSGCVATAMSQIMRYYSYPNAGQGIGQYKISGSSLTKMKSLTNTYDWKQMIDNYNFNKGDDTQREAVAVLMFDAGAAAQMSYAKDGSGALSFNAAKAFVNNFQYDSIPLRFCDKMYYTDEEWNGFIYKELTNRRPILYSAIDTISGGHAFVFDGMDNEGKVHVNWGWNSRCDGFYDIFDLSPKGLFSTSSTNHFTSVPDMIFGFRPQSTPDASDVDIPALFADNDFFFKPTIYKDSIDIGIHGIFNANYRCFNGKVYLTIENNEKATVDTTLFFDTTDPEEKLSPIKPISTKGYNGIVFGNDSINHFNLKLIDTTPGTYKIAMIACPQGSSSFDYIRSSTIGGPIIYNMVIADNGGISFTNKVPTSIQNIKSNNKNDSEIRVYDTSGRMIYKSAKANFRISDIPDHGVMILRQGTSVKKIIK